MNMCYMGLEKQKIDSNSSATNDPTELHVLSDTHTQTTHLISINSREKYRTS